MKIKGDLTITESNKHDYAELTEATGWILIEAENASLPSFKSGNVVIYEENASLPSFKYGNVVIHEKNASLPSFESGYAWIYAEASLPNFESGGVVIRANATLEKCCPKLFAKCVDKEIEIKLLDQIREIVMRNPASLNMDVFHSVCGTAHCLAGWAETLTGDESFGTALQCGTHYLPRSAHLFFTDNERVLKYLENREYADGSL